MKNRIPWILAGSIIFALLLLVGIHASAPRIESRSSEATRTDAFLHFVEWDGKPDTRPISTEADRLALAPLVLPQRDVADLARRFRSARMSPGVVVPAVTARIGESRQFWISDGGAGSSRVVTARLVERSAHIDAFVQDGESVVLEKLRASIATIENQLLPTLLREFAASTIPLDSLRLAVLNVRLNNVAGYYSSINEQPAWVFPTSNELPLIGMNIRAVAPGSDAYASTLSHELTHFLQWRLDPSEDTWVNEGSAELAVRATGYEPSRNAQIFASRPNTSLTQWTENISQTPAHYGAGDLFFSYVANRLGGFATVGEILARPERGTAGIEPVLLAHGVLVRSTAFDSFFLDWIVANWANVPTDVRFGYPERPDFHVTDQSLRSMVMPTSLDVAPYAARYIELERGDVGREIEIAIQPTISVIAAPAREGTFWWSGRGDNADSRLTRVVDLQGVPNATLRFATWFDLESGFDYAYVSVSNDDGATWITLQGEHSTRNDPNGVNLGNGFTGHLEDPHQWVSEAIDLSAFAGKRIQIRFEVVNDDAYVGDGFAVDSIGIPEIGWKDQPGDPAWIAEGFARIHNQLASDIDVRIVLVNGSVVSTIPVLDPSRSRLLLTIPPEVGSADRSTIIVANHTPWTSSPTLVQLSELPR